MEGTRARSRWGDTRPGPTRGVPHPDAARGYPSHVQWGTSVRGVPHLRYPPLDLAGGVPHLPIGPGWRDSPPRVPQHQTWGGDSPCWGGYPTSGTPPSDLARGYPTLGTPPVKSGWGDTPSRVTPAPQSDLGCALWRETDGVLDTPRSVCLLRSRKRTFLFCFYFVTTLNHPLTLSSACHILLKPAFNCVFVLQS